MELATLVMIEAAKVTGVLLLLGTAFLIVLLLPRGPQTRRHSVFIAADPRTVWETYFFHAGRRDFRPGVRFLSCEILAEKPLTVSYTAQVDYASRPVTVVVSYDVYEPYRRFRASTDDGAIVEEGELEQVSGGTCLRSATTAPKRGWLLPSAARRRDEQGFYALKDVCEGRDPPAPRGAMPAPRWWERWAITGGLVGFIVLSALRFPGAATWPAILPLAVAAGLVLPRWTRIVSRLFALG